jgi:hypothetical protein
MYLKIASQNFAKLVDALTVAQEIEEQVCRSNTVSIPRSMSNEGGSSSVLDGHKL